MDRDRYPCRPRLVNESLLKKIEKQEGQFDLDFDLDLVINKKNRSVFLVNFCGFLFIVCICFIFYIYGPKLKEFDTQSQVMSEKQNNIFPYDYFQM